MTILLALKIMKYVGPFLIGLCLAGWLTHSYYKGTIAEIKTENIKLTEANNTLSTTIEKMKEDSEKDKQLCKRQLNGYKELINDLQKIDMLGNNGDKDEETNSSDIVNALNGMFERN